MTKYDVVEWVDKSHGYENFLRVRQEPYNDGTYAFDAHFDGVWVASNITPEVAVKIIAALQPLADLATKED